MRRNLCILHRRKGVAAVEAVFVLPFLFYLLIGVWEAGRMVNVYQVLTNAAREAARDAASGQRACCNYQGSLMPYVYDPVNNAPLLPDDSTLAWQAQLTALNYIRNAGLPLSAATSVKISNLGPHPTVPYNSSAPIASWTANYSGVSGNKITVTGSGMNSTDPGVQATRPDPSSGIPPDLIFVHLSYADFATSRWNVVYLVPGWGANVTLVTESAWYTARDQPVNVDTNSPGSTGWNGGNPAPLPPL